MLTGVTTMTFCAAALPSGPGPCLSNVQTRAMTCKVFPRPISSARMQPAASRDWGSIVHLRTFNEYLDGNNPYCGSSKNGDWY